jgi:hypothetical protein
MALAAIIPRMVRIGEHPLGAGLSRPARAAAVFILLAAVPSTFLFQSFLAASDMRPRDYRNLYDCARVFAPHIPEGALILVSGGNCLSGGHPSAYDTPYFFYWLDKKGFSICGEEHTIDNLASYASRGVRFFVAERSKFARFAPGFESELRQRFRTIAECDEALLIDISSENPRT